MSSIKMATEMLDRTLQQQAIQPNIRAQLAKYIQILQDETDREIRLINDLLSLSRLEANADPILLTAIEVQSWLPHLVEAFEPISHQCGQHLTVMVADALPSLKTDLVHLEGILGELIGNAQKYTPYGETIAIAVAALPHDNPMPDHTPLASTPMIDATASTLPNAIIDYSKPLFSISVRNSGIEIPDSEQKRIFDKFYRIPSSDPWKYDGTGLGLALVKCRVEYLNGKLTVNSHDNCTIFTVILPSLSL